MFEKWFWGCNHDWYSYDFYDSKVPPHNRISTYYVDSICLKCGERDLTIQKRKEEEEKYRERQQARKARAEELLARFG